MSDQKLDLLYGLLFNQLVRSKTSPTYVEKKVLNETLSLIRTYLLKFVEELKKKITDYEDYSKKSYLTWDVKHYENDAKKKLDLLQDFENKINNTPAKEFLGVDFSVTDSKLDKKFPDFLPKSLIREDLNNQWEIFQNKNE
jgi:hypothetical protein